MRYLILIAFLYLLTFFYPLSALSDEDHHSDNHLGAALGPVYIFEEENIAVGAHLHYLRTLPLWNESFSIGVGLGYLFDEHIYDTYPQFDQS